MRANDLHMAASVDPKNRLVLVTGAIDQSDVTVVLRIELPEPGLWTLAKAEVNLTDGPWKAWQMTLGESLSIPESPSDRLLVCRQLVRARYFSDRNTVLFDDGEVRPGEAILKLARLEASEPLLVMSHNRAQSADDLAAEAGFGMDDPKIEIDAAVRIVEASDGFSIE